MKFTSILKYVPEAELDFIDLREFGELGLTEAEKKEREREALRGTTSTMGTAYVAQSRTKNLNESN